MLRRWPEPGGPFIANAGARHSPPAVQTHFCASAFSTAAINAGSLGVTSLTKLETGRPWRSIRYLWKFQTGAWPVLFANATNNGFADFPFTDDLLNIGKRTP